jgi:hypothetical protein
MPLKGGCRLVSTSCQADTVAVVPLATLYSATCLFYFDVAVMAKDMTCERRVVPIRQQPNYSLDGEP